MWKMVAWGRDRWVGQTITGTVPVMGPGGKQKQRDVLFASFCSGRRTAAGQKGVTEADVPYLSHSGGHDRGDRRGRSLFVTFGTDEPVLRQMRQMGTFLICHIRTHEPVLGQMGMFLICHGFYTRGADGARLE